MKQLELMRVLEGNLARQLAWIAAAESKISFAFAVNTAMLGVLAAVSPRSAAGWTATAAASAAVALVALAACLVCLAFASFPRVDGPKGSLLYFGGIAQREATQYTDACRNLTEDAYLDDLSAQAHRNAEIASVKFGWIRRALIGLYLAVVPWVATVYLFYSLRAT